LIVNQSNNGESLSEPARHKPKRHNAKLCPFAIRQRIVNALANGDSKRAIARALRVSNNTVTAIAEQEWQQVESRKARIAAQAERMATAAADRLNTKLESGRQELRTLLDLIKTFNLDPAAITLEHHTNSPMQNARIAVLTPFAPGERNALKLPPSRLSL
jgi:hypothetical protein